MVEGTPLRGEVWMCAFPAPISRHPAVVLTVNRVAQRLSAVTVAVVTKAEGPRITHVPLGADAGLKHDSYVNCTDIYTVSKARLQQRRGLLSASELAAVESNVRTVLGL